ncbi:iron uptake transporter permease EfeU [Amycolatopsis sp. NPDC005232]|uniref:iron uptake transporter permease EfeU n=1 Tax=Amycolatopsis sp. NPDC005232 TaxID=3157027 RepID=UPI0033ACC1C4
MWAEGVPNLVIGLREGLEIGLVVSILLAALRKTSPGTSATPLWTGVLAAAVLSLGFGAALTFSRAELTARAQSVFAGVLSLLAVVLVTLMVFWMRRASRALSGELRARIGAAAAMGSGALALTAFLAVAREGVETALFVWTTVQASGRTWVPLLGAAVGLAVAFGLCVLLYRTSVKLDLGKFFTRSAVVLIVIAAGVLSYGIGELQTAGVIPGHTWTAFDLSRVVSTDAWWVSIVTGITNLAPVMTWTQVIIYVVFAATVLTLYFRPVRNRAEAEPEREERQPRRIRRPWLYLAAAVVLPLAAVAGFVLVAPSTGSAQATVTVTAAGCAEDWAGATAGRRTFTVVNQSPHGGEIYLVRAADASVLGEIEGLGPGTRRSISVDLAPGSYAWRCVVPGELDQRSPAGQITGTGTAAVAVPVLPIATTDLAGPLKADKDYMLATVRTAGTEAQHLYGTLQRGDLVGARTAWLPAQLAWERTGAAYGAFDELGVAIAGLPQGLPLGTADPGFTGLRRLEDGLWHGESAATLTPVAAKLVTDLRTLAVTLPTIEDDPADLPRRAHEILEDAVRRHLTGLSDQGAGSGYAETLADVDATTAKLDRLHDLITARRPQLLPTLARQTQALRDTLDATRAGGAWRLPSAVPLSQRQQVDAALGAMLESLATIPTLLEIRAG